MNLPILNAMEKYYSDEVGAYHTPGHKQGLGAHKFLKELITDKGLKCEVSLNEVDDSVYDSEKLAAKLFKADDVIYFVNGTTSAIQTMIFSQIKPNEKILVGRNMHKSVMAGIILSGAIPIYLPTEFNKIPLNVSFETVKLAIKKFPDAKAVLLTSPSYYGICADLEKISEIVHKAGMKLFVDEAHGAHLIFSEKLPKSAIESGADIVAQSTHKLLGSLTQTSMLLLKNKSERVRQVSKMLQTSSPNSLLTASLDIARLQMQEEGFYKVNRAVELAEKLRKELKIIPTDDITKILVNVSELNMTGFEAEKILREELKIQCEMSDYENVLFIISYADNEETILKLKNALEKLPLYKKNSVLQKIKYPAQKISEAEISPREIFYSETEIVELKKAVDKICAEEIITYPPGIPIINLGERITAEKIEYLRLIKNIDKIKILR